MMKLATRATVDITLRQRESESKQKWILDALVKATEPPPPTGETKALNVVKVHLRYFNIRGSQGQYES